ncbi:MAG: DUF167 domain-containing protein [Gammaproteobacteria bacterium]
MLAIRVRTRAARDAIDGVEGGRLRLRTTAAPADGKANDRIRRIVARACGVAPSRVTIRQGAHSRDKVLAIAGVSELPPAFGCRPRDGL